MPSLVNFYNGSNRKLPEASRDVQPRTGRLCSRWLKPPKNFIGTNLLSIGNSNEVRCLHRAQSLFSLLLLSGKRCRSICCCTSRLEWLLFSSSSIHPPHYPIKRFIFIIYLFSWFCEYHKGTQLAFCYTALCCRMITKELYTLYSPSFYLCFGLLQQLMEVSVANCIHLFGVA